MTVTATDILIFLTGFGAVGVYAHLVWDVGRSRADREDVLSVSIAHHIDARTAPVEWHTVLTCVNRSLHSVHVAGFGIEEVASRRQARRELKHPEELGPHRRMRELEIGGSTVRDAGIDGTSVLRGFILLDDGSIHYSRPNPFAPVTTEAAGASRGSAMFGGWGRLIARAAAPGLLIGASAVVLAIFVWATPLFLRVVFLAGVALVAAAAGLRVVKLIRSRNAARNPVNLIARAIVTASYGSVERYTMLVNLAIVSAGLVAATAAAVGGLVVLTTDGYWRGLEIVLSLIGGGAVGMTTLLALTVIHVSPSSHRVIAAGDLGALRRGAPRQRRGPHRRGK